MLCVLLFELALFPALLAVPIELLPTTLIMGPLSTEPYLPEYYTTPSPEPDVIVRVPHFEIPPNCRHNEAVCPHTYVEGRIEIPTSCPHVLECWDNGLFAPNQCRSDGMCFCVNVT